MTVMFDVADTCWKGTLGFSVRRATSTVRAVADGPDDSPERGSPLGILLANAALVATLFAFVTIAVRALVVARLDTTTAVGLVQTSGPVNVFVGTLTAGLPGYLSIALLAFMYWQWHSSGTPLARRRSTYLALSTIGVTLLFVGAWISLPLTIAVAFGFNALGGRQFAASGLARATAIALGFVFVALFFVSSGVWLPQERLEISGRGVVFGYVLEEEGRWVSILEDDDREILLVEEHEVESRQACSPRSGWDLPSVGRLVADLFGDPPARPTYPPCSE